MLRIAPLLLVLLLGSCRSRGPAGPARLPYPPTRTVDQVDDYHGTEVADPYRWLEDDNADETKAWVEAQNEVTFDYLGKIKARKPIRERLEKLLEFERSGIPTSEGGRYFFRANDGTQEMAVLYVTESLGGERRVLIDPNQLSEDGTVSLGRIHVSRDGELMAYALSTAGSDWRQFRVMDVESGQNLAVDELSHIKFSGASWATDGSGFYYSRFPAPEEGRALTARNINRKVYFHRIGTPQAEDQLVYERPDDPTLSPGAYVTRDGTYLVFYVWKGSGRKAAIYVKNLDEDGPVETLFDSYEDGNVMLGNEGSTFYFWTDRDAPKGRIVAVDLKDPKPEAWRELVPEAKNSIESASLIGDRFVVEYLKHAHSCVMLYSLDGTFEKEVELPTLGSISRLTGEQEHREMFFGFSSFTYPGTVLRYDFDKGDTEVVSQPDVDFNPEDFEVKQVAYPSRGGHYVTMFIAHKKSSGFELDGSHPTLLSGYGGFNRSQTPGFSIRQLVWMEMGGVYALPALRGGGEYGAAWHEAGMREKKQNVFDDFITAAESLIANGYTSPDKLAIAGGSNGGLLVGACMMQRPKLFGACLPAVGVMDMLRYHKFTVGRAWEGEYGSSDDPDMFEVLYRYSPYHNIEKAVAYPATMVTTADHDDRVVPAHSFKFAARLQAYQGGPKPVLIRIETSGGHGGGSTMSKYIDKTADQFAFLAENLKMDLPSRFR